MCVSWVASGCTPFFSRLSATPHRVLISSPDDRLLCGASAAAGEGEFRIVTVSQNPNFIFLSEHCTAEDTPSTLSACIKDAIVQG